MKKLQIISEFPEERTPSCKDCIFSHEIHDSKQECGCGLIHNAYIQAILKGNDPDEDGNHPLMLCNQYNFSKPIIKLISEPDI